MFAPLQPDLHTFTLSAPSHFLKMPRFDFLCKDCDTTFEHLLLSGEAPVLCLKCGSTEVTKLLSPPSVIFKGGGFYKTDSKGASSKTPKIAQEDTAQKEAKKADVPRPETPKVPEKKAAPPPEKGLAPSP